MKSEYEQSVEKAVDRKMAAMHVSHRYRWCTAARCGCMGCVNRAGKFTDQKRWLEWVDRNPPPTKELAEQFEFKRKQLLCEHKNVEPWSRDESQLTCSDCYMFMDDIAK